ncbi:MAG TPA: ATP-binding protein, partial [Herpetosiphonaceae bacterium]|nr:ATP-binding protein [Herpetosiphonaceae bacterium]
GADSRRPLNVTISIAWNHGLAIEIADDGVGLAAPGNGGGAGAGLRLHRGLLSVLGGTFQAGSPPGGGTSVKLTVPEDLWALAVLAE